MFFLEQALQGEQRRLWALQAEGRWQHSGCCCSPWLAVERQSRGRAAPSLHQGGLEVGNPKTQRLSEQMAEICWSCRHAGSAEHRQLLLRTGPLGLCFLRRNCRRMQKKEGYHSHGEGGKPRLWCRARGSLISRLSPHLQLCPTLSPCSLFSPSSSSLCSFFLRSSCPPLSMETLPGQGLQSHCALVQVSMESLDGDGKRMVLTSLPAIVCSASLSIALSEHGFSLR